MLVTRTKCMLFAPIYQLLVLDLSRYAVDYCALCSYEGLSYGDTRADSFLLYNSNVHMDIFSPLMYTM